MQLTRILPSSLQQLNVGQRITHRVAGGEFGRQLVTLLDRDLRRAPGRILAVLRFSPNGTARTSRVWLMPGIARMIEESREFDV